MKTAAGWTLNQRNPTITPAQRAQTRLRFGWFGTFRIAMNMNARNAKTSVPPASPSRPSVRFTPLLVPTIATTAMTIHGIGPTKTSPTIGTRKPVNPKWFWR